MSTTRSGVTVWSRLEVAAPPRTRRIAGVLIFAALIAISAKISIPVPGTAVPFTFQPMVVVLGGALLGARMGAASAGLYLAAGAAGLPVFALPGAGLAYLLGPTGGYLLAYPAAAYVTGFLAGRSAMANLGALLAGFAVLYAGGVAWLAILSGWSAALMLGIAPFLIADLVKVVLAVAITSRVRDRSRSLFGV